LNLVLTSKSGDARPLSVNLSVQAMRYNGRPAVNIKTEVKEATLQPGKDLSIPVLVPFSSYHKHMVQLDSLKISAIVTDKQNPDIKYLAEDDVVLLDPPISVTMSKQVRFNQEARAEVVFMNPLEETLTDCTVTLSGSGLVREEQQF
ncbi:protein-glutamine gamma-glutamyltransferase 5-like, partial [Seriola lalandi dorsalis]|uniref:protein-glutamine gamma-glutamyltransferase 5-like n=1 Tax=Seriola lalandi dorsalis TaxID=1841481 RepID=UPI000C6FAE62